MVVVMVCVCEVVVMYVRGFDGTVDGGKLYEDVFGGYRPLWVLSCLFSKFPNHILYLSLVSIKPILKSVISP